jgi:peptidoglycan/xylan/chitin deacetylase (PgdA/CDA1 family)
MKTLAILGYHKIGEPPAGGWESWYYIPERLFTDHLEYLGAQGWQVIDANSLLRGLADPGCLPERAAMITFDDGYRSNLEVAVPCLLRFGYPAVVFVPTGFIGGLNSFDVDIEPEEPICGWEELRELDRCGVSVQSHGVSHRGLSELDPADQEEELRRSKATLERGLGKPVEVFSYAYGDAGRDAGATARALRRAGYRAACLYGGDPNPWPVADPYRLARLAMGPDTDLPEALAQALSSGERRSVHANTT